MELKYRDIREALHRLKAIQFSLNNEYEENGGEVTESTMDKEQMIETIVYMLQHKGTDTLARLLNSVDAEIEQNKSEQAYLRRQQKKLENFKDDILECADMALRTIGEEKVKGDFGYSFTQHISSSIKPDNKLIKDMYHKEVEKVIRDSKVVPDHIVFTLTALPSLLKKGEDMPDYLVTTSRARATYRKPRKGDSEHDEFGQNDFE